MQKSKQWRLHISACWDLQQGFFYFKFFLKSWFWIQLAVCSHQYVFGSLSNEEINTAIYIYVNVPSRAGCSTSLRCQEIVLLLSAKVVFPWMQLHVYSPVRWKKILPILIKLIKCVRGIPLARAILFSVEKLTLKSVDLSTCRLCMFHLGTKRSCQRPHMLYMRVISWHSRNLCVLANWMCHNRDKWKRKRWCLGSWFAFI